MWYWGASSWPASMAVQPFCAERVGSVKWLRSVFARFTAKRHRRRQAGGDALRWDVRRAANRTIAAPRGAGASNGSAPFPRVSPQSGTVGRAGGGALRWRSAGGPRAAQAAPRARRARTRRARWVMVDIRASKSRAAPAARPCDPARAYPRGLTMANPAAPPIANGCTPPTLGAQSRLLPDSSVTETVGARRMPRASLPEARRMPVASARDERPRPRLSTNPNTRRKSPNLSE